MANISAIKLPNGTTYNLKDTVSGYITNAGVTGVKGNAESSYRTGQVNLTPANLGAAAVSHTHTINEIYQGQSATVGGLDPLTQAMIGSGASNKSFHLPATAIKIEYSTNGGSTWVDYGATDMQKIALFSETRSFWALLGKNSATGSSNTVNNWLRVTIEPTDRYVFFNGLYIWMSTQGNTVTVDLERSTIGAKDTFTSVFTGQSISGWSGNNIRYFSGGSFGGGSTQTSNNYKYRLTFKQTAVNTNYGSAQINDIRFLGVNVWTSPNSMVSKNHLYTWDESLNATFPAQITATQFNGPLVGNVTGNVTGNVSGSAGSVAWSGVSGKPTATNSATTGISIANHSTTSIYGVSSSTTSVYGVSSTTTTASKVTLGTAKSIPNVTSAGSASTWTFESKSIPNVTAAGSASTWTFESKTVMTDLTMTINSTDSGQLDIAKSTTTVYSKSGGGNGTAPTLGTAITVYSKSGGGNGTAPTLGTAISVPNVTEVTDVTVPIKNADATTVPIKNTSATTVVTSATHSVTDNGHIHTI